jgi:hypothetical protein
VWRRALLASCVCLGHLDSRCVHRVVFGGFKTQSPRTFLSYMRKRCTWWRFMSIAKDEEKRKNNFGERFIGLVSNIKFGQVRDTGFLLSRLPPLCVLPPPTLPSIARIESSPPLSPRWRHGPLASRTKARGARLLYICCLIELQPSSPCLGTSAHPHSGLLSPSLTHPRVHAASCADMPNSPFAKIAEEDGLDFNADKAIKKAELSAAQKENDVFDEHHVGRRWAEKLALMTTHTGAFHELHGVKTPYGGVDEDGVDPWIPESQIAAAKEEAKMKLRVASRKFMGERLAEEHKKINDELLAKIGRPKVPRNREKGSPSSVTEAQLGMIGM